MIVCLFVMLSSLLFEMGSSLEASFLHCLVTLDGGGHRILLLNIGQIHAVLIQQNVLARGVAKLQFISLSQFYS